MSKAILDHSLSNITPSRYLQLAFERRSYASKLIPNTIPLADYRFKERKTPRPRLLYVRALAEVYNPRMALHVLKGLIAENPSAELCMVGPGKDGALQACKSLAEELEIEANVRFTGKLSKEEWRRLSTDYDIFINTTNKDNTPISVMEAMALGLPIVSTNPGGVPYLIEDGEEGLLVSVGDVNSMIGKIRYLLVNPLAAQTLAINARRKVERFDWRNVRAKWVDLFAD